MNRFVFLFFALFFALTACSGSGGNELEGLPSTASLATSKISLDVDAQANGEAAVVTVVVGSTDSGGHILGESDRLFVSAADAEEQELILFDGTADASIEGAAYVALLSTRETVLTLRFARAGAGEEVKAELALPGHFVVTLPKDAAKMTEPILVTWSPNDEERRISVRGRCLEDDVYEVSVVLDADAAMGSHSISPVDLGYFTYFTEKCELSIAVKGMRDELVPGLGGISVHAAQVRTAARMEVSQ